MASDFDLNLLVQSDEEEFLFDLNKTPPKEESYNSGDEVFTAVAGIFFKFSLSTNTVTI